MLEELHRQKQHKDMKKQAEDLQRQRDEMAKQNEKLHAELKKKSSNVDPPRTPPRRCEGEAPDALRNVPITLPTLKDVAEPQAALRAGELMPLMSDVSEGARVWWSRTVQRAQDAYAMRLTAGPIDRMAVQPNLQVETKYVRLEPRVLSMLLAAVPQTVKQEAISLREMTCVQLVFRILKLYPPQGLNEKSIILSNLTQTTAAKSAAEAGEMLRQWRRQLLRARELGLHFPDPLLQVSALSEVMRTVVVKEPQASFRISNFRMTHMVDAAPTAAHSRELPADVNYVNAAGDKGGGKKELLARKATATMLMEVVLVEELGCASTGVHVQAVSRATSAPTPMTGTTSTSTTRTSDVGSVLVWNTWPRTALLVKRVLQVLVTKSPKGSPKGKGKTKDGKNDTGKSKGRDKPAGGVDRPSKDSQLQVAQIQQPQVQQGQQQAAVTPVSEQTQPAQPSVIGEVASLPKTMRTSSTTPSMLAAMVDNNQGVLLDSGAMHIPRGPYDETEWMQAIPTEVQTATGKTQLRMSQVSRSLLT
eukprot:s652_g19.t1